MAEHHEESPGARLAKDAADFAYEVANAFGDDAHIGTTTMVADIINRDGIPIVSCCSDGRGWVQQAHLEEAAKAIQERREREELARAEED